MGKRRCTNFPVRSEVLVALVGLALVGLAQRGGTGNFLGMGNTAKS